MLQLFKAMRTGRASQGAQHHRLSRVVSIAAAAFVAISCLAPTSASADVVKLRPTENFPSMRLNKHEQGEAAIRALGNRLPDVAKWYYKTPDEFSKILRSDRLARIDRDGRMYFVEEFSAAPQQGTATGEIGRASCRERV